ncbi:conserved hypothetical protein [uncultured delta proteobacterium]|uniref:Uncharacterized protein n=1 Tax=uncultured delta proteobacterium TaxID=34034 RepID=A0A212J2W0_9DELT|nr:conserved hypothetical protein [uncultured delta proteobacterium]
MSEATSKKLATSVSTEPAARARTRSSRSEAALADIQENSFFKVVFSDSLSLEDKIQHVTKALEFTNNKEEDRARVKEFDSFKEYLQSVSEEMSKQRIQMTDTEVFAELQRVYSDFNNDLTEFIDQVKPLTDITDALYNLRQSGETRNVLAQIKADKEWEFESEEQKKKLMETLASLESRITDLTNANFRLAQDKGLFGFGQIRPDSKAQILTNEALIEKLKEELSRNTAELEKLNQQIQEREVLRSQSFEAQKLRELLDLTSEEHTLRQAGMVESALKFVNQGKERFGAIRTHLDKMVNQIEGLGDNNGNMIQIFAVMNEATKKAENTHRERRKSLEETDLGDNLVEKMKHDEECRNLDEHIDTMATATVDTMQTYGELTTEAIKIRNMQAATKKQVESARAMHSRGIASVASQLSVVVTAVNSAAINEAQSMASNTLSEMAKVTNDIAKKEAIRIATGRDEINYDLEAMLQNLAEFGDTQREATEITRTALETMRSNLEEIEKLAKDVQTDTKDFVGVAGDVLSKKTGSTAKAPVSNSPFKL